MTLGTALLIVVGVVLLLSVAVKEWEQYEKTKSVDELKSRRRIFRKRK